MYYGLNDRKSRRDDTLLTAGFNLRITIGTLKSPEGTTLF